MGERPFVTVVRKHPHLDRAWIDNIAGGGPLGHPKIYINLV
jgi:hypothetical protein